MQIIDISFIFLLPFSENQNIYYYLFIKIILIYVFSPISIIVYKNNENSECSTVEKSQMYALKIFN